MVFVTILLVLLVSGILILANKLLVDRSAQVAIKQRENAQIVAEAGIDHAIWCLNHGSECANPFIGETGSVTSGEFISTVTSPSSKTRLVESIGYIPSQANPKYSKTIKVTLTTDTANVAFNYGVQAGVGGIELGNNAYIQGNVYANGPVIGTNGSYITGDAILAMSSPTTDANYDPSVSPLYTRDIGTSSSTEYLAQSFISTLNEKIYSIDLKIAQHNNPSSTITLYIYSDNSNNPGSNISGSGQQLIVSIPNDSPAGWENGWTNQVFNPSTMPILIPGNKYWLVVKVSSSNSTRYWTLARNNDDALFADGTAKLDGDLTAMPGACAGGCDIAFKINMGGIAPTLDVAGKPGICDNAGICGNGHSRNIKDTTFGAGKKAYYQNLTGTVKADGGADTCTEGENGPYCFDDSPDLPPQNFPVSDSQIAQMEAQAASGGTESVNCNIPDGSTIGPKKYNCDVFLNGTVTMAGTIWVNGDLTIINNAILQLAEGYGNNSGTIIADYSSNQALKGRIILSNNGDLKGNSNPETYVMAISAYRDPLNITSAIDVSNNLAAAVLYAPYGIVAINNNASLKEVTAQKIDIAENGSVIYESGLANVNFTGGPGASWIMKPGSYQTE
ncbi:MAG: choice-of-anchor R domain-containing protein [Patescibacteria group bacterium]|jgi:hypothetical protein